MASAEKSADSKESYIHLPYIIIGCGCVLAFYLCLFTYLWLNAGSTREKIETRLPTQVVMLSRSYNPVHSLSSLDHGSGSHAPSHPKPSAHGTENHGDIHDNQGMQKAHKTPLPSKPLPGLYKSTADGPLPAKRDFDELTPFQAYRKYLPLTRGPAIAFVMNNFGQSSKASNKALEWLPAHSGVILSPYTPHIDTWQEKALRSGHELWLYLPMEREDYVNNDQGVHAMLAGASIKANEENLRWALGQTTNYAGVAGYVDQSFDQNKIILSTIGRSVFQRGLGWFEMNEKNKGSVSDLAKTLNAPFIQNRVQLKPEHLDQGDQGRDFFAMLEARAQALRQPIVITFEPYPKLIEAVANWADKLEKEGIINIVPPSMAAQNVDLSKKPDLRTPQGHEETSHSSKDSHSAHHTENTHNDSSHGASSYHSDTSSHH